MCWALPVRVYHSRNRAALFLSSPLNFALPEGTHPNLTAMQISAYIYEP
uniref:Uncharacterized protein n=1 Tax=Pseudomonas marincola TaxID=437900 RepID=A0A653E639_9PSED